MGARGPSTYRPSPHHIWSPPGHRAEAAPPPLAVRFDPVALDLVAQIPESLSESISQFELPSLCEWRPHKDPRVESWLRRWLDGEEVPASGRGGGIVVESRVMVALQGLAAERPEVCPLLRSQLDLLGGNVATWLLEWPRAEPWRTSGLPRSSEEGLPLSAEEMEVELHAVLAVLRGSVLPPGVRDAGQRFYEVATSWVFKLDSLYGLDLLGQPGRLVQALGEEAGQALSLLRWEPNEVVALLQCPFFRPPEQDLWNFARCWQPEGSSAEVGGVTGAEEALPFFTRSLVWELMPPRDELLGGAALPVAEEGGEEAAADAALTSDKVMAAQEEVAKTATEPADEIAAEEMVTPGRAVLAPAEEARAGEDEGQAFMLTEEAVPASSPEAAATATAPTCIRVTGSGMEQVPRRADCPMASMDEPEAFHCCVRPGSETLHCWNAAKDAQLVGASRRILASQVAMSAEGGSGRFRFDFRVNSGSEAEAAHLLEVGLMVEPSVAVYFPAGSPGAGRPPQPGESVEHGAPFFRFVSVVDTVVEGVRLSVEVDFDTALVHVRNVPDMPGLRPEAQAPAQATPLRAWLSERGQAALLKSLPPGELDCPLFKEHAEHMHDLISRGRLDNKLAGTVLQDVGVQCVVGGAASLKPPTPEDYHFYIVVPPGVELEIF
mmetsp:Transcript_17682/g.37560  ORF Transcript_17682/g.37560 Transcript_17682/m.37560 type:complete len:664 (+) Transcript_17682:84-2075(+)